MTKRNSGAMELSSSMEDYLETIAHLKKKKGAVRVKDIGKMLGVKPPSVSAALETLSRRGLVLHETYGHVDLTEKGELLARAVQRKHDTLTEFLTGILGIGKKKAEEDACKMEHSISPETFEKLEAFLAFVNNCPEDGLPRCLDRFAESPGDKKMECRLLEMKKEPAK